jgi:hypothetical protein
VFGVKQGALVFDEDCGRYDIRFDISDHYGGLHCGQCFEVFVSGKWVPTRIEKAMDWYLAGVTNGKLDGLRVRI